MCFVFVTLEIEPKALCMYSIVELHFQSPSGFVLMKLSVLLFLGLPQFVLMRWKWE